MIPQLLRKLTPNIYNKLRLYKSKIKYNRSSINSLFKNNINLIENIENQGYFDWKKKNYFKLKNEKYDFAFIEINNSCNINCVMCDTKSSTRIKSIMKIDKVEGILKEIKRLGIKYIGLHTIGDPLVNKNLPEILKLLRKYQIFTSISTNGLLLDKYYKVISEYYDIMPDIRISIDGATKNTYEKIRAGGKWEDLINNLNLAVPFLQKIGFKISTNLTISKDNFFEIGKFIVFFRKYFYPDFQNIECNFMSSLSPSNDYFLKNNVIPEKTYLNSFCKFVARGVPYYLVDGKVSVCCRDYDGSLIIGDTKNQKIEDIFDNKDFKNMQESHETGVGIEKYTLCNTCYEVDQRVNSLWINNLKILLYLNQNKNEEFYQDKLNKFLNIIKKKEMLEDYKKYYLDICNF